MHDGFQIRLQAAVVGIENIGRTHISTPGRLQENHYRAFGGDWREFDASMMVLRRQLERHPICPAAMYRVGSTVGSKLKIELQEKRRSTEEWMPLETTCALI